MDYKHRPHDRSELPDEIPSDFAYQASVAVISICLLILLIIILTS